MEIRKITQCPECGSVLFFNESWLEDAVREVRVGKMNMVIDNMLYKRGPFYEKWKTAMEARGKQKRCGECFYFDSDGYNPRHPMTALSCRRWLHHRGEFACKHFKFKE